MPCPVCGNDVWADAPHMCPEGFVAPARAVLTFYAYNSLNQCCRAWMLMGWRDEDGRPKLVDDERGRMHFECPQREFVVSGHKYNMRALGICNGTNDVEPRLSWHLNVQEHQVRPMPANRLHSFLPVGALADQFQILASLRKCP